MAAIKPTLPILHRSVDRDSIIQDCNQYYADKLEYTIEEVIGSSSLITLLKKRVKS